AERDAHPDRRGQEADRAVREGAQRGGRRARGAPPRRARRAPLRGGGEVVSTYALLAELPLVIDAYELEGLVANVSSDFERKSTVIRLRGGGEEGLGEDVTYDAIDHDILQAAGPSLPLAGRYTVSSFSEHLATLELFPRPPEREVSQRYRVWA